MGESGLVSFERGEEDDAMDAEIFAVRPDDAPDNGAKEALVVVAVHKELEFGEAFGEFRGIVVVIEDGVVEVVFGGEMAEYDGLGDAGRGGDFLGGGASVAFAREDIERSFDQLTAAVAGGESLGSGAGIDHLLHCKLVLTYGQESFGMKGLIGFVSSLSVVMRAIAAAGLNWVRLWTVC